MTKQIKLLAVFLCLLINGCCKHKSENTCIPNSFRVNPFIEKYAYFTCGGNLYEYQYIKRKQAQIDSLTDCTFSPPIAFPVDETDMVYIMYGKMSYYYRDSFQTQLLKDTCLKTLTYQVNLIQTHTDSLSNGGGVLSTFCAVQNIPADYKVEVKYKYVPL
jgi:hypothetical protein